MIEIARDIEIEVCRIRVFREIKRGILERR